LKKLSVLVLGLGENTTDNHLPAIKNSMYSKLTAICDKDIQKVSEWKDKLRVKGYTDVPYLFEREHPDFI